MTNISNSEEVALVVDTGPGLGLSLARCTYTNNHVAPGHWSLI